MGDFNYIKWVTENKYGKPLYENVEENTLSDIGDKIKPALSKAISVGKSQSKQIYNIIKKEVTDPENAEKLKNIATKTYNGIKTIANNATNDPEKLKSISKIIPSLKNSIIFGLLGSAYKIIAGASIESSGLFSLNKDIIWGDASTVLNIAMVLIALKLVIYALQIIANIRKGTGAVKGMFKENEEEMAGLSFDDIENLFEFKN